jgi:hypothetical protein
MLKHYFSHLPILTTRSLAIRRGVDQIGTTAMPVYRLASRLPATRDLVKLHDSRGRRDGEILHGLVSTDAKTTVRIPPSGPPL